ncbi:unnamed protein product [Durusdinium trenchii]|uniref:Phosphoglucomutase n=1 Tax=Durusdinium trenchii TaxID=1381693 RepID=A0ABP0QZT5_9DINO
MGIGSSCMNDLVVLQSTQGVCAYLESVFGAEAKRRGVCVGFDHRAGAGCSSKSFATQVSKVFLSRGFTVWLFRDLVATPFVPWCIEQRGCCAGIMITASHNPAADNGYKLYWSNGAQIIPPHDAKVAALIDDNLEPWTEMQQTEVTTNPLCKDPGVEGVIASYFERLKSLKCLKSLNVEVLPVVYTAMHGVGCPFVQQAFDAFGHGRESLRLVGAQCEPDPSFPTVAFPNPEEGKGALQLAFQEADSAKCNLVIANDPDADRLAVAERNCGEWHVFSGNELGALLGHWAFRCWQLRNDKNPKADVSRVCMVASTVSSKFLKHLAAKEGFRFVETLTGFKWMGSRSAELRNEGFEVIFSYEEAIGFCVGDMVKDKDGVAAAAVFVEMAKALRNEGTTCFQHLHKLYLEHLGTVYFLMYGRPLLLQSYVKSPDPSVTRKLFEAQRGGDQKSYPKCLGGFVVTGVRDLTVGYDSRTPDGVPELPLNLGGEMITYYFDAVEADVTLRSSGTEPKIKFYSEMRSDKGDVSELRKLVRAVVCTLLDPFAHGLEVRPEDQELLTKQDQG